MCVCVWYVKVCVSVCALSCTMCVKCKKTGGEVQGEEREREKVGLLTIHLALEAHYPHLHYFHIANPSLITVIVRQSYPDLWVM